MNDSFPSIWLEVKASHSKPLITAGFYREWSHNGLKSGKLQVEQITTFCDQIDKAAAKYDHIIVTGDTNLCSINWRDEDFSHKNIADP